MSVTSFPEEKKEYIHETRVPFLADSHFVLWYHRPDAGTSSSCPSHTQTAFLCVRVSSSFSERHFTQWHKRMEQEIVSVICSLIRLAIDVEVEETSRFSRRRLSAPASMARRRPHPESADDLKPGKKNWGLTLISLFIWSIVSASSCPASLSPSETSCSLTHPPVLNRSFGCHRLWMRTQRKWSREKGSDREVTFYRTSGSAAGTAFSPSFSFHWIQ